MTPAPQHDATVQALNTIIKALVLQHGQPEATTPLSFTTVLTNTQLQQATGLTLTISPQPQTDIQPEPWLLITIEGV